MIKLAIFVVTLCVALAGAAYEGPAIFLPPDAEVVNIVGNGFKLQITQLNQIKNDWTSVAKETSQLENRYPKDKVNVDANLFEKTKQEVGVRVLGQLDQDLQEWIVLRATQLTDKIDDFESELQYLKDGQRIVVQILLLNTLIDLENLSKENIKSMRWIKNKLRVMQKLKDGYINEVEEWVNSRINENVKIEQLTRRTNNPGEKWITNTQAIKRILHEQRFSEMISKKIVAFLGGKFSMMERTSVFEIHRTDKKLDDGLYYKRAKGIVPAHFPFSAQEAIANGA